MTPLSPDLFSIKGTENLGNKFVTWREEWDRNLVKWKGNMEELPNGSPKFVGYVTQQHNLRTKDEDGMTQGWKIFGGQVDQAVKRNIVDRLESLGQVVARENYKLGAIPNLHSLVPYSQNAKKPVYKCTGRDGLKGEHISKARESVEYYSGVINILTELE